MNKIKAILNLTRASHGLFLAIAVVIGQLVTIEQIPPLQILIPSIITPIAISGGAFAVNDYMDYKTDKENNRTDRPLVSGELKRKTALQLSILLTTIGIISSYTINLYSFQIALAFTALSYAYAVTLKKIPLIGNISIAASMTIPFIYGALTVSNQVPLAVWVLGSMAFLAGTGREIVKSIQDMKGDKLQGRKTLPIKIGKKPSAYLAVLLVLTAISISITPYLYLENYLESTIYISTVTMSDILFLVSIKKLLSTQNYRYFRQKTLMAIGVGLIAFLLPIL